MKPTRSQFLRWLCGVAVVVTVASAVAQPFVNFEGKQTSPVRLSPDGSRLFAVNTPDNRLSVFDVSSPQNPILIAEIPVGLEPVSVNPRNNDEVWVVNEVSDNVSVVSVSQHIVTDTIPVKDEPADVAFANGRAFITAARNNRITVVDLTSHNIVTNIPVFGENPRALTVNSNGTRVYAAFTLSGNRTTILPADRAPAPPPPTNPNLPPPPQVSLIVDAADPVWTNGANAPIKYRMPDNDVVEIDTASLAITRYFPRVGTVNFAIAARPNSGDLYVANTDARNLTRFEPNLRGAFITNQISRIDINSGAVTRYDLNPGFEYVNFPSLRDQTNALSQPTAIVFGPSGGNYFVAAFGSDRIAQVSTDSGAVTARLDLNPSAPGSAANPRTKRGPRGLALKGGQALYVLNRIANTISVVGLPTLRVVREIPTGSHDPTPSVVRNGRGFLYDAKLSGNGTVSCASCHIDSEMDMLAWDLGNPGGNMETNRATVSGLGLPTDFVQHPMKGPMTTQTLKGLNGLDPLHWRGDRTNFLHFNGAFDGLLGGSVLPAADMIAYRDFINTIRFSPNPNQNTDRTLPSSFADGNPIAGRLAYLGTNYQGTGPTGLRCNTCHAIPNGTDKSFTPAQALQESQDFKVPQLRSVYQKMRFTNAPNAETLLGYGIIHDGIDPSLFAFLSRNVFGVFANDAVVKRNVGAFVQCFDSGMAPAVGYMRILTAANVDNSNITSDWNLLEAQANLVNNPHLGLAGQSLTNIDLIVKGTVDGKFHGFVYQAASGTYKPDTTNLAAMTRAQLRTKVLAGDTLTLLGMPTGAGVRSGIDRNGDGVLDGDVPAPNLRIAKGTGNAVVAWSTNASGYVLEQATNVAPANWATETSVRGVVAGEFNVTNAITSTNRFFRLRGL
jgi:YVTN family beta-propeller protein